MKSLASICDDIKRKNRLVLSYAKRLEALNTALDDLLTLEENGDIEELPNIDVILEDMYEISDDAKCAVSCALDKMEYIRDNTDYLLNR